MRTKRLTVVGLVTGLIVGVTLGIAGIALAGNSPPTAINTCTSVNHHGVYGKTKVTTGSSCPGTKYFQTWNNGAAAQAEIASLAKYKQLMLDVHASQGTTVSYAGVDFSNAALPDGGTEGCTSCASGLGDFHG